MSFDHFWCHLFYRGVPVNCGSLQKIDELWNLPNCGANPYSMSPIDCKGSSFFPCLTHDLLFSLFPSLSLTLSSVSARDSYLNLFNRSPKTVFFCNVREQAQHAGDFCVGSVFKDFIIRHCFLTIPRIWF